MQDEWAAAAQRKKKEPAPAAVVVPVEKEGDEAIELLAEEEDEGDGRVGEFRYADQLTDEEVANIQSKSRAVAADPGRSDLFHAAEVRAWWLADRKRDIASTGTLRSKTEIGDSKQRDDATFFRYSSAQRRFECKEKVLRDEREKLVVQALQRGIDVRAQEARLAGLNPATMDPDAFLEYLHVKHAVGAAVREVYEDPEYRRLRFAGLRYRTRSEDKMVNNFKEKFGGPEETTVFWGDWASRYNGHGRGTPPTATIRLCRLLARHGYMVVWVEEQYTSKHCHGCERGELSPFRKVQHPKPGHEGEERVCWGLTRCDNCGRMWNRDRNAALNILWTAVQVRC